VPKGDQAAACVAAASVLAKVTRDRIMVELDRDFPQYGFAEHKGYCTPAHDRTLNAHGPCTEHRFSFVNVVRAVLSGRRSPWSTIQRWQGSSVVATGVAECGDGSGMTAGSEVSP